MHLQHCHHLNGVNNYIIQYKPCEYEQVLARFLTDVYKPDEFYKI